MRSSVPHARAHSNNFGQETVDDSDDELLEQLVMHRRSRLGQIWTLMVLASCAVLTACGGGDTTQRPSISAEIAANPLWRVECICCVRLCCR